jgi:hypothetical protein
MTEKFSITIAKNSKVEHGPFIFMTVNFSTVVSIFACIYLHNLSLFFKILFAYFGAFQQYGSIFRNLTTTTTGWNKIL